MAGSTTPVDICLFAGTNHFKRDGHIVNGEIRTRIVRFAVVVGHQSASEVNFADNELEETAVIKQYLTG